MYCSVIFQVLSAATVVAKHTSALCNACRLASSKTDNPVAKRHFVQSAKDVANSTANLVKAIKVNIGDSSLMVRLRTGDLGVPGSNPARLSDFSEQKIHPMFVLFTQVYKWVP